MKIAVMQPYLFPYIGYFQLMNAVDKFIIYDDVNFINKGWINRNNILINGEANLFTVPLKKSSQNKLIKNIRFSESVNWRMKLLKTIEVSYRKAICYREVYPIITDIIQNTEKNISQFIYNSLSVINSYLKIKTKIIESSSVYLNKELKQQDRIIDICKKESASNYVNPIGGMDLYSKELFSLNGIRLNFIKQKDISYKQFSNTFVSSLSIIDVLMFNSQDTIKEYLKYYELV